MAAAVAVYASEFPVIVRARARHAAAQRALAPRKRWAALRGFARSRTLAYEALERHFARPEVFDQMHDQDVAAGMAALQEVTERAD